MELDLGVRYSEVGSRLGSFRVIMAVASGFRQ